MCMCTCLCFAALLGAWAFSASGLEFGVLDLRRGFRVSGVLAV